MERCPPFRFITRVTIQPRFFRRPSGAILFGLLVVSAAAADAQVARRGLPGAPARDSVQARRPGTGTIDGFIGDTALNPIFGAEIKILATNVKVNTGPNGRFRMNSVPAGPYVLVVRRGGYTPVSVAIELAAADTLRLSYTLERGLTTLAAAVISTPSISLRMTEFDARRKSGRGEFMTEAEIRARNSVYSTDLMRRFMTVNVSPNNSKGSGGMPEQYALSRRETGSLLGANSGGGGYCPMLVFVDDVKMPTPFNLDMLPSPRLLSGIEVYNGSATIPPRWAGFDSGCGIILIWTKDGS